MRSDTASTFSPCALGAPTIDYAVAFAKSKGRLPEDMWELVCWLKEFAAYEIKIADSWERMLKDEIALRHRPILLPASSLEKR